MITGQRRRGAVSVVTTGTARTALDAAVGRDAHGAYDHRGVLAKIEAMRAATCVEELVALPRDTILGWARRDGIDFTDEDLRELETYLARRGIEHRWPSPAEKAG